MRRQKILTMPQSVSPRVRAYYHHHQLAPHPVAKQTPHTSEARLSTTIELLLFRKGLGVEVEEVAEWARLHVYSRAPYANPLLPTAYCLPSTSFPFDRGWWFAADVVADAIDAFDFVDDPCRHPR